MIETILWALVFIAAFIGLGAWCCRDMEGLMVADWTRRGEPESW